MSYGPPPSLVGTLFTNANNSPSFNDPSLGSNTCDCNSDGGTGGGGGGGGTCTDQCSCDSGGSDGGSGGGSGGGGVIVIYLKDQILPQTSSPNPSFCRVYYILLGGNALPTDRFCQVVPMPGVLPGCVALSSRISLFPEGCKAAGEVEVGDMLLTRRADGSLTGERVVRLRVSAQPCVLLETEEGKQLHCSLSHEVMVADPALPQGRRTVVTALTLQDRLLTEEGTPVALRSMVRQPDGQVVLIALDGPEHVYLSDGLWSHNATKGVVVWPLSPP